LKIFLKAHIDQVLANLPALPREVREKLLTTYGLSSRDVDILMSIDSGKDIALDGEASREGAVGYFEELCRPGRDSRVVSNWMTHELLGQLSARKLSFLDRAFDANRFGQLIDLVASGGITRTSAKLIIQHLLVNPQDQRTPAVLAEELHLSALPSSAGDSELTLLCQEAIDALPSEATAARGGNRNVLNKLVGWIMKNSKGRVDAKKAREQLESLL
jgi:aspartyl-tRNA(Asn)/glutamyl-tRNA(Gln) amidotransferase subunit B